MSQSQLIAFIYNHDVHRTYIPSFADISAHHTNSRPKRPLSTTATVETRTAAAVQSEAKATPLSRYPPDIVPISCQCKPGECKC